MPNSTHRNTSTEHEVICFFVPVVVQRVMMLCTNVQTIFFLLMFLIFFFFLVVPGRLGTFLIGHQHSRRSVRTVRMHKIASPQRYCTSFRPLFVTHFIPSMRSAREASWMCACRSAFPFLHAVVIHFTVEDRVVCLACRLASTQCPLRYQPKASMEGGSTPHLSICSPSQGLSKRKGAQTHQRI